MKTIIEIASEVYGCNPMDKSRKRNYVWARRALFVEMRKTDTLEGVGDEFGLDHATVLHHISKHEILYGMDFDYTLMYNRFLTAVGLPTTKEVTRRPIYRDSEPRNQVLVDMVKKIPDDLVDGIYVKLDAIIRMSKVTHPIR